MERKLHTIDAEGQTAGRLASRVAFLLRGKHKVTFQTHKDEGDLVSIANVGKLRFSGKKLTKKIYHRFTGYPGGIRSMRLDEKLAKHPEKLFRQIVFNMLPKNKLRDKMIKRLTFKR